MTSQQRCWNQNGGVSELSEVISRAKMCLYREKNGIHSTHIKKNCRIFGFTCPLRSEEQKIDMYYNAELYYISCEFNYQFIYL